MKIMLIESSHYFTWNILSRFWGLSPSRAFVVKNGFSRKQELNNTYDEGHSAPNGTRSVQPVDLVRDLKWSQLSALQAVMFLP